MSAPIFTVCAASAGVQAYLTEGPLTRIFEFGEAPEDCKKPYVVWQVVYGNPENYLGSVPDIDAYGIQVDVYADNGVDARAVRDALKAAIEPVAHIVSWNGESRDPATRAFRLTFTVDWLVSRN